MAINPLHLRTFHAVAEAGSFTQAARQLRISQPTLSEQVRALENRYQVSLFSRQGRQIGLTAVGEELYDITRRLDVLEDEALHCLTDASELRRARLRLSADAPVHAMCLLGRLEASYPGMEITLSIDNSANLVDDVLEYRTDVAVIADLGDDDRLSAVPIVRNDLTAFVRTDHELAGRGAVSAEQLIGHRIVLREQGSMTRHRFEQALAEADLSATNVFQVDARDAVHVAVRAGLGVGIVAETELPDDDHITAVRVDDLDLTITEYLVCRADRRRTRLITAVFDIRPSLPEPGS